MATWQMGRAVEYTAGHRVTRTLLVGFRRTQYTLWWCCAKIYNSIYRYIDLMLIRSCILMDLFFFACKHRKNMLNSLPFIWILCWFRFPISWMLVGNWCCYTASAIASPQGKILGKTCVRNIIVITQILWFTDDLIFHLINNYLSIDVKHTVHDIDIILLEWGLYNSYIWGSYRMIWYCLRYL